MRSIGQIVQKLWLTNTEKFMLISACYLDFDQMTLVLELDLDMMVTYFYSIKRSISQMVQKTDRHV